MMNKLNKTIPEGMRDLLYTEAVMQDKVTKLLTGIYERYGFARVVTPTLENYDYIAAVNPSIEQESVYKLTDNSGRLIALRPDNTTPIARVAATKLQNVSLPQKLYYNQNIYRINGDYSGHRNEVFQSGIELIGATGLHADFLCILIALEALKSLGVSCKLEIGHVGFYNALIREMNLDSEEADALRGFVDAKNFVSLGNFGEQTDKIHRLPMLFGGEEIFKEAYELAGDNDAAVEALNYVGSLYDMLKAAGYQDDIMIDLGIVHKFDYYTGVVFRGYMDGAGEAVLKGGRYDTLLSAFGCDLPATGFAVNVCAATDALLKAGEKPTAETVDVILFYDEAYVASAIAKKYALENQGKRCELSPFDTWEETKKYAENRHIATVINMTKEGR